MPKIEPLRLNLQVLEEGASHHEWVAEPSDLELDDAPFQMKGPIVLRAEVYRVGQKINVRGPISARVEVTCGRCLKRFEAPVSGELRIYADTRPQRDLRTDEESREDDLGIVYHDGQCLDLRDEVRQALWVEVPWHPVCQGDCKGLCPTCGADRNQEDCGCAEQEVDPRWAALMKLKDSNRSSTE